MDTSTRATPFRASQTPSSLGSCQPPSRTTPVTSTAQTPSAVQGTPAAPRWKPGRDVSPTRQHFQAAQEAFMSRQNQYQYQQQQQQPRMRAGSAATRARQGGATTTTEPQLPTAQYTYVLTKGETTTTTSAVHTSFGAVQRSSSPARGGGGAGGRARARSASRGVGASPSPHRRYRKEKARDTAAEDEEPDDEDQEEDEEKATRRRSAFLMGLFRRTHEDYMESLNAAMDRVTIYTPPAPPRQTPPHRPVHHSPYAQSPSPQRHSQTRQRQNLREQAQLRTLLSPQTSFADARVVESDGAGVGTVVAGGLSPSLSRLSRDAPAPAAPVATTHSPSRAPFHALSGMVVTGSLRRASLHCLRQLSPNRSPTAKEKAPQQDDDDATKKKSHKKVRKLEARHKTRQRGQELQPSSSSSLATPLSRPARVHAAATTTTTTAAAAAVATTAVRRELALDTPNPSPSPTRSLSATTRSADQLRGGTDRRPQPRYHSDAAPATTAAAATTSPDPDAQEAYRRQLTADIVTYQRRLAQWRAKLLGLCGSMEKERDTFLAGVRARLDRLHRRRNGNGNSNSNSNSNSGSSGEVGARSVLSAGASAVSSSVVVDGPKYSLESPQYPPQHQAPQSARASRADTLSSSTFHSRPGLGRSARTLPGGADAQDQVRYLSDSDVEALKDDEREVNAKNKNNNDDHGDTRGEHKSTSSSAPSSLTAASPPSSLSSSSLSLDEDQAWHGTTTHTEESTYSQVLRAQDDIMATVALVSQWRGLDPRDTDTLVAVHSATPPATTVTAASEAARISRLLDRALLVLPQCVEDQRQRSQTLADVPLPLDMRIALTSLLEAAATAKTAYGAAAGPSDRGAQDARTSHRGAGGGGRQPFQQQSQPDLSRHAACGKHRPPSTALHLSPVNRYAEADSPHEPTGSSSTVLSGPPQLLSSLGGSAPAPLATAVSMTMEFSSHNDPAVWRLTKPLYALEAQHGPQPQVTSSASPPDSVDARHPFDPSWSVTTGTASIPVISSATLRAAAFAGTACNSPASAYTVATSLSRPVLPSSATARTGVDAAVTSEAQEEAGAAAEVLSGPPGNPVVGQTSAMGTASETTEAAAAAAVEERTSPTPHHHNPPHCPRGNSLGTTSTSTTTSYSLNTPRPASSRQPRRAGGEDESLSVSRATTSGQSAGTAAFPQWTPHPDREFIQSTALETHEAHDTIDARDGGCTGANQTVQAGAVAPARRVCARPLFHAESDGTTNNNNKSKTSPAAAAAVVMANVAKTTASERSVRQNTVEGETNNNNNNSRRVSTASHSGHGDSTALSQLTCSSGTTPRPPALPQVALDQLLRTFYHRIREQDRAWAMEKQALLAAQAESYQRVVATQATTAQARAEALALVRARRHARIQCLRDDCAALESQAMALDVIVEAHRAQELPAWVQTPITEGRHRAAHKVYKSLRTQEKIAAGIAIPHRTHVPPTAPVAPPVVAVSHHGTNPQEPDGKLANTHTASSERESVDTVNTLSSTAPQDVSPIIDPSPRAPGTGWGTHSFAASLSAPGMGTGGGGATLSAYVHYQQHGPPAQLSLSATAPVSSRYPELGLDDADGPDGNGEDADSQKEDGGDEDDTEDSMLEMARGVQSQEIPTQRHIGYHATTASSNSSSRSSTSGGSTVSSKGHRHRREEDRHQQAGAARPRPPSSLSDKMNAGAASHRTTTTTAASAWQPPAAPLPPSPSSSSSYRGRPQHTPRRVVRLSSSAALHSAERLVDIGVVLQRAQTSAQPPVTAAHAQDTERARKIAPRGRTASTPCSPAAGAYRAHPPKAPTQPEREPTRRLAPSSRVRRAASWSKTTSSSSSHSPSPFLLRDLDFIYNTSLRPAVPVASTASTTSAMTATTPTPTTGVVKPRPARPASAPAFTLQPVPRAASAVCAQRGDRRGVDGRPPRPGTGGTTTTAAAAVADARGPLLGSTYHYLRHPSLNASQTNSSGSHRRAVGEDSVAGTVPRLSPAQHGRSGGGTPTWRREQIRMQEMQMEGHSVMDSLNDDVRRRVMRRGLTVSGERVTQNRET